MLIKQVKSSNVSQVGYDEDKNVLRVFFLSGGIYDYLDVPRETFDAVVNAKSVGKTINSLIKTKFEFQKVA